MYVDLIVNIVKNFIIKLKNDMQQKLIDSLKFKKFKMRSEKDKHFGKMPVDNQIKSGNVLLMKDKKYILVGDVNENLGICDDCTNYELKDIRKIATLTGF
jgi:hypothetical protein